MTECPRNFTKEQIIEGLKAGRTLRLDRRDAPELQDLLELERQGLVTQRLVQVEEQYSYVEWKWKSMKCCDECPGDDTCEHHKVCMCGSEMEAHDMYSGHSPVSMHDYYSNQREEQNDHNGRDA